MQDMNFHNLLIQIYRATNNFKPLHKGLNRAATKFFVPALERIFKFRTHHQDPLWFRTALILRYYEKDSVQIVKHMLKPGMIALDIGAHVGYYSKLFSGLVGKQGKVVAFEPHPITYQSLAKNMRALSNVIPLEIAVADRSGRMPLYDYQVETGSASLHDHESRRAKAANELIDGLAPRSMVISNNTYNVEVSTIDNCLEMLGITHIDFLKIDIEGAEILALYGMKKTLQKSDKAAMIIEFAPTHLRDFGFQWREAIAELKEMGFINIKAIALNQLIEVDSLQFGRICGQLIQSFSQVNLICLKG